jgi:hypothetical protein
MWRLVNVAERKKTTLAMKEAASTQPEVNIDDDFDGWLLGQASALRERRYFLLNCDRLAEELEDMAALRRGALRSDLTVLLTHLLKLEYAAKTIERGWSERQWKLDVVEHRDRVKDLLRESSTLRSEFESLKREAYSRARKRAGLLVDPNQNPVGPEECPWSTEQILDDDFFSASKTG